MKTPVFFFIIAFSIFLSCNNKNKSKEVNTEIVKAEKKVPSLEFVWETDTLLTTCEAVLYDKTSQLIYVSNINNNPWEKDGNGFISTINLKGEIIDLKWVEGINAPKGLGISNGKLYVNDVDCVVEIEIVSKKITNSYFVKDTPQLNDITIDNNGVVYASGSRTNTIYKIIDRKISKHASDTLNLKRLNGLLFQKKGVYYLDAGTQHFGIYNNESKTFNKLTEGIGHGDGIVKLENGDFIISSWKGEIFYINSTDWSKIQLLDTRKQGINAADIGFIHETQTLLVPTFFHNRVMAYRLKFK